MQPASAFCLVSRAPIGNNVTISIITNFAPGQFIERSSRKQRDIHWRKLCTNPNCGSAFRQIPRQQEFIVPESSVRSLDDVLGGAQLLLWIRVNARIPAGQIPNAS